MASFALGQVSINPMGNYSSSTAYNPLDAVSHGGGSYLCSAACTGVEPGVSSGWANYWQPIAAGITSISATADSSNNVTLTWTLSNGQTGSITFAGSAIPDGSVTAAKLAPGAVTAAKLNSDVTYEAVGIYVQASVPTSSSADGIYLVTG